MILFGFILAVCFVPGWTGFSVLTGWIVLSLALPFLLWGRAKLGAAHWLGLAFIAYAAASLFWTLIPAQGIGDLWMLALLGGCFVLGSVLNDPRSLWLGLSLGFGVSTAIAIAQWFGWDGVYRSQLPAGLFVSSGIYGEIGALLTVALISVRLYWPLVFTVPALALSGSRIALVAVAVALMFMIWDWRIILIVGAFGLAITIVTLAQRSSWDSASERKAIWADTAEGLTFFGHGAGSFMTLYPTFAKRTDTMTARPEDPHNEFLRFAFEYGLGALPLLLILTLACMVSGSERFILVAWLVIAFFDFPTRIPVQGLIGMVALGRLCSAERANGLLRGLCRSASATCGRKEGLVNG